MTEPDSRLRLELRGIEFRLWRRVDVPLSSTLVLHDVIQVAVGWTDSHMFEFVIGERVYGEPMPDDDFVDRHVFKAAGVRLKALIERGVERFLYVYDWRHKSSSNRSAMAKPMSITRRSSTASGAGRRRTSAVPPGFIQLLEAALDPAARGARAGGDLVWQAVDPVDVDERWVRADAFHVGRSSPGWTQEASRRSAARLCLICGTSCGGPLVVN